MKWITHIGFSVLIFLIIKEIFEITSLTTLFLSLVFCIFGGIIPDIDIYFKLFSKHRGMLHSLVGTLIISILILIIFKLMNLEIVAFCFFISYFFHLLLDSFTPAGIMWFPLTKKSKGKIKTGGFKENMITLVIWIIVLVIISIQMF